MNGKLYDINLKTVNRYFQWAVAPVRFFAIPYSATSLSSTHWEEACDAGGLILDRLRLLELQRDSPISAATEDLIREQSRTLY